MSDLARVLPTFKSFKYQSDRNKKGKKAKFMAFDLMEATKNRRLLY
tara:strand:+ start:386 stop:523 length:138 start_codon:yes stop_codon:yes gene_type:complete